MSGNLPLLSTAYFPPVSYMSRICKAGGAYIEKEENYIKQTFRNRFSILTANGPVFLSVPVHDGSFHKTPLKEVTIDYSKRWQQVHVRTIHAAYRASPFFEYYIDQVERIINGNFKYLIDLNSRSLELVIELMRLNVEIEFTSHFLHPGETINDLRYLISPKTKEKDMYLFTGKRYTQVFETRYGFIDGLSSLDLLFNTGPDSPGYL